MGDTNRHSPNRARLTGRIHPNDLPKASARKISKSPSPKLPIREMKISQCVMQYPQRQVFVSSPTSSPIGKDKRSRQEGMKANK